MLFRNMDITYGEFRYTTFDRSMKMVVPPVETNITLNLIEIELITRERITEDSNMYFEHFPTIPYDSKSNDQILKV